MADTKISQLVEVTTPAELDVLPIVNSLATKKITLGNLRKGILTFDLLPTLDDTYDLGSASKQWQDLYLSGLVTSKTDVLVKPHIVVGTSGAVDYLCDGTADNVQIQEAIDAVNTAGGGIVFIKEGTYDIIVHLIISSNVTLMGEGWTTILQASIDMGSMIISKDQAGNDNITIKDLYCDANSHAGHDADTLNPGEQGSCVALCGSDNRIEHIKVANPSAVLTTESSLGIHIFTWDGVTSSRNIITRCLVSGVWGKGIGIHAVPAQTTNRPTDNIVSNNIITGSIGQMVWTAQATRTVIVGNIGDDCQGGYWSSYDSLDTIIANNIAYSFTQTVGGYGLFIGLTSVASRCTIANNISIGFENGCVVAGGNHRIISNHLSGYAKTGIYASAVDGINISDNDCDGSSVTNANGHGIEIHNSATESYEKIIVKGNRVVNTGGVGGYGINIRGDGGGGVYKEIIVSNNFVEKANYINILLASCINAIVNENISKNATCDGAGWAGIRLTDCTDCIVSNNRVYDDQTPKTQVYGILEEGTSDYNTYIGNDVRGNKTINMSLVGANNEIGHNIGY